MDLYAYGGHQQFKWTHEYLVKLISTGRQPILTDPILLNAFRSVNRKHFVPESAQAQAYEDREIELGYREQLTRPTVVAEMLKLLQPQIGGKYLDIGSGSGYFATILAKAIGESGQVYSLDRIQWLWETCRLNQRHYPETNNQLKFLYRDGNEGLKDFAPYNGIHVAYDLDSDEGQVTVNLLKEQLKVRNGFLVYPSGSMIKLIQRVDIDDYVEEIVPGYIFPPGKSGLV